MIEVMDKDKITHDDVIGTMELDLKEIQDRGHVSKWYPLSYKNKAAGEILLDCTFESAYIPTDQAFKGEQAITSTSQSITAPGGQKYNVEQSYATQPILQQEALKKEEMWHSEKQTTSHCNVSHEHGHVFMEQSQVVEPRTFTKTVDVVETRSVLREIEVLEPQKVLKEVQYTEAVPIKKRIECVEPQVVMKEVEVIEPRLVTKEIKVVENVSVKKFVEIIEPHTVLKDFDTYEPQCFTKQVEVIEQVPVKKQVTVTEAVTVTKNVDFIEPVITTRTITKEVLEPVVIDQKITQTIGPATLVETNTEVREQAYVDKISKMKISEEQGIVEKQKLTDYQINEQNRVGGTHKTEYASTYQSSQQRGSTEAQSRKLSPTYAKGIMKF